MSMASRSFIGRVPPLWPHRSVPIASAPSGRPMAARILAWRCWSPRRASWRPAPRRAGSPPAASPGAEALEVFVREGCPHCADAERFIEKLRRELPGLEVTIRDVSRDRLALERLRAARGRVPRRGLRRARLPRAAASCSSASWTRRRSGRASVRCSRAAPPAGGAAPLRRTVRHRDGDAVRSAPPSGCRGPSTLPWIGTRVSIDDVGLPVFTDRHRAPRRLQPLLDVGAGPDDLDARGRGRPATDGRHRRHLRRHPGHRLLRLHGGVAQPLPADRPLARLGDRPRRDRPGGGRSSTSRTSSPSAAASRSPFPPRPSPASTSACAGSCTSEASRWRSGHGRARRSSCSWWSCCAPRACRRSTRASSP